MIQQFKDISGFEGLYQISNNGYVKSLQRTTIFGTNRKVEREEPERILKLKISRDGYYVVHLRKNGKSFHPSIHRLVALAYIPNPENKKTVNHKDGNKLNNDVLNLEWATAKENINHAFKSGLFANKIWARGENASRAKLKEVDAIFIKNSNLTSLELSETFNVTTVTINMIKRGAIWKHI